MQLAAPGYIRQSIIIRAVVSISAIALIVVMLVVAPLIMARPTESAPIHAPAPTIVHGEYRIPAEPVDYNDPNYLGSYGG